MSYTAFGSGVSTEMEAAVVCRLREFVGYTAFGSGVSTEMRPRPHTGVATRRYTAFGSGVSTEMIERSETYGNRTGYTAFGSGVSTEIQYGFRGAGHTASVTQPSAQG